VYRVSLTAFWHFGVYYGFEYSQDRAYGVAPSIVLLIACVRPLTTFSISSLFVSRLYSSFGISCFRVLLNAFISIFIYRRRFRKAYVMTTFYIVISVAIGR
jgi:hypothetical protein